MLREQTIAHIEELMARYPNPRGALLMVLHAAQEEKGWLAPEDFAEVGDVMNLDPAEVESVASFYTMYYTKPQGKCLIQVCGNIACMLDGGYPLLQHIHDRLGIATGEQTPDGLFGLMEVECLAACDAGPCVQLSDREFYRKVTPAMMDSIIDHFQRGGDHPAPYAESDPVAEFTARPEYIPIPLITEVKARPAPPTPPGAPTAPAAAAASPVVKIVPAATVVDAATADRIHAEALIAMERAQRLAKEAAAKAEADARDLQSRKVADAAHAAERRRADDIARMIVSEKRRAEEAEAREAAARQKAQERAEAGMTFKKIQSGPVRIGEAAPAVNINPPVAAPLVGAPSEAGADAPAPPVIVAEPVALEPVVLEPVAPASDLGEFGDWEPENPYLRFLKGTHDAPDAEPAGTPALQGREAEPAEASAPAEAEAAPEGEGKSDG